MARQTWKGLDGLRGIAVLAVVVFHASVGWAVNGYVGVDVFFALSGFLITWLLIDERSRTGSIHLKAFYVRRMLRLYPALLTTCFGVMLLGLATRQWDLIGAAGAALLYAANWWIYTGHDSGLLGHTWTLSLEEHFYFVWPILVILSTMRPKRWRAVGYLGALLVLALVLVPWPHAIGAVRSSYLRATPIVWGSALAVLMATWKLTVRTRALAGKAALSAVVILMVILTTPTELPEEWMTGLGSVPGALSVAVIAGIVSSPNTLGLRLLEHSAIVWLGRRSYGIYLYHLPIISIMMHQVIVPVNETLRAIVGAALSILVAAASYRWIEYPFLKLKYKIAGRRYSMAEETQPPRSHMP